MSAGLAVLAAAGLMLSPAQAATPATPADTAAFALSQTKVILTGLEDKSSATDPRYLSNDTFVDGSPECVRCTIGPATLLAAYGVRTGDAASISQAVRVIDKVIADHQRSDGAYVPAAPGEGGPDIQTVLAANVVAETYLILGDKLDAAHRGSWQQSLSKSADWLIGNGNLTWYTNGNLNLADTVNMSLTYRITAAPRFQKAAADSLAFTLNPPQARWPGYGLTTTRQPTKADGSDGAGYLAESGAGGIGYDPAYTMVQANLAASWYGLTGNADALRLTNLLFNQLQPRIRTSDWTLDVSGGTRRPTAAVPGTRYGFTSSSLPVLAGTGARPDLQPLVGSQFAYTMDQYTRATTSVSSAMSYGYATEVTPAVLALTPPAVAPAVARTVTRTAAVSHASAKATSGNPLRAPARAHLPAWPCPERPNRLLVSRLARSC